ncbi:hypothetical protein FSARC_3669 [Fusarium sarcochroum]|uniref:Major facilitator superfamily (MFS) profile domain-containing protein n=1 Tax=Fusarium sarcochroum TaxID=1208366 RepID=A0A8H4U352_9HYPO|nr:hypothetical protein FSARC_3669 [Fusarium sarcochroum]
MPVNSQSSIRTSLNGIRCLSVIDAEASETNFSHDVEKDAGPEENGVLESPDLTDDEEVDWDGPDDPEKPVNWHNSKKWRITFTISMLTFLTPFASSMMAPAIDQVMREMNTTNRDLGSFAVSIYLLGYAFGPLIIVNMPMLIVFRFLTGTFGACPFTVGPSTVGECFRIEERGTALAVMNAPVVIGPCIGPAVGAYLSRAAGWRWCFWLLTIMGGVALVISFVSLRETHPPTLLKHKAKGVQKASGHPVARLDKEPVQTPLKLFLISIRRPIIMLTMSPLILGLSLLAAVAYGVLYLLFTTLTEVFETRYGIVTNIGLVFFGIGVGQIVGILAFGAVSDAIMKRMAKGGEMKPEYRLPPMYPGAAMIPVGLLIYGWTAQYYVHWFVPLLGNFFLGVGVITVFVPVASYLVDAYPTHAASATAATTVLRSIGGALLPLAGPRMYEKLDQGWGNTLLAVLSLGMMGMIWLTQKYGEKLRTDPKYKLNL